MIKMENNKEKIESELGDIMLTKEHFERERSDSDSWKHIESNFGEDILDKLHFSSIESIEFQQESMYSPVVVETEEDSKKVFFKNRGSAEEFYNRLNYRWRAWRQNYQ